MNKKIIFGICLVIIVFISPLTIYMLKSGVIAKSQGTANTQNTELSSAAKVKAKDNKDKPADITSDVSFISAGDILFHMPEVVSAETNGTYDFKPMFSEVKDIISSKDISVADFETTIDPKKNLSGYPAFNSPVQTLDALKDTGFKVLLNDHNHSLDTGLEGLRSTNSLIKQYGFKVLGSGEPNEDKSVIMEKNNIKIGMLSYTYSTNFGEQYKDMINYIDENKIKADVEKIRPNCDFLIVYLHIGTEYVRSVEPDQANIVNKIAAFGADAILCSHPHVAKKTEIIKANGKDVLINYSMGNFLSNQYDKYTDMGSMESMIIEKQGAVTKLKSAETIPVYRLRYSNNGKTIYKTVPYNDVNKFKDILGQNTLAYIDQVSKDLAFTYSSSQVNVAAK
ncbi:MAG: CapA family protein [Bacillota bacterium]|nr:CapA family protein [Bacillota bacterium]